MKVSLTVKLKFLDWHNLRCWLNPRFEQKCLLHIVHWCYSWTVLWLALTILSGMKLDILLVSSSNNQFDSKFIFMCLKYLNCNCPSVSACFSRCFYGFLQCFSRFPVVFPLFPILDFALGTRLGGWGLCCVRTRGAVNMHLTSPRASENRKNVSSAAQTGVGFLSSIGYLGWPLVLQGVRFSSWESLMVH